METPRLLFFTATVLPLICTPGPDMLFVVSQAIAGGRCAGLRATLGVCLGYAVHSVLVALGVAALVAASPMVFATLRWIGVCYLVYLASQLLRAAMRPGQTPPPAATSGGQVTRGFLTAFLNPKGMMIMFAILPQLIASGSGIALQATVLCAVFLFWCAIVYALLSLLVGNMGHRGRLSDRRRRLIDGTAGGMLVVAAAFMTMR